MSAIINSATTTLSACVSVLGYVLYVMSDDWDDARRSLRARLPSKTADHVRVSHTLAALDLP
jgi:hypothetical protein